MNGWERALVLAPHTDDGEFGCGATIARLRGDDVAVRYVAFSVPEPAADLAREATAAAAILGVDLDLHDFPARNLGFHRQEILDLLVRYERDWRPDVVFAPSAHDIHQDHQAVHIEALRAFKHTTLFGYELPWNNYVFDYDAFFVLTDEQVEAKWQAISCYESQADRPYADAAYVRGLARSHGVAVGVEHAEAFEVCRAVL